MKHILLTWYGITDLRASMGFEFQGPILGALGTGRFDAVSILAYTKKESFSAEESTLQRGTADFLREHPTDMAALTREKTWQYVDALANTPVGHTFYREWLVGELDNRGIHVELSMRECFLKELNDTEGIYFSAVNALKSTSPEDHVTFFLSPGTPVMAFSWALAMLSAPRRNIDLLASPDFRRGVQSVALPKSVLTHVAMGRTTDE